MEALSGRNDAKFNRAMIRHLTVVLSEKNITTLGMSHVCLDNDIMQTIISSLQPSPNHFTPKFIYFNKEQFNKLQ